jgi:hypothetical protein
MLSTHRSFAKRNSETVKLEYEGWGNTERRAKSARQGDSPVRLGILGWGQLLAPTPEHLSWPPELFFSPTSKETLMQLTVNHYSIDKHAAPISALFL